MPAGGKVLPCLSARPIDILVIRVETQADTAVRKRSNIGGNATLSSNAENC